MATGSAQLRNRFNAMGGGASMGMVGAGEPRGGSMYSPQTSNMMARAVGLHSNAAASAPANNGTASGLGTGGRRADLLSMLGKGPKTGAPMTTSALTARLAQAASPKAATGPPTGLAERLAHAGLAPPKPPQPAAPRERAPEMQTEMAAMRADAESIRGVISSQASEIRTLTGQLSEVATLRNEMAELRQQMRAVQLDAETERRQAPDTTPLQAQLNGLQEVVANMDNDAMLEMLSAEVSNACSMCRATVRQNTIEYTLEQAPSARGGPDDDAILAEGMEGTTSSGIPAGQELVLVYPMYTRDMDDMGAEVFMRRRAMDSETAQVTYTYVKVLGSYGNDTIQYVAGFSL